MLAIMRNEIKKNLKDKGMLFWMLLLPIIFIVLFASIFGGSSDVQLSIHYVDEDQSEMSGNFLDALSAGGEIELIEVEQKEEGLGQIEEGELSGFVWIPEHFSQDMLAGKENQVHFYYDQVQEESVRPVMAILDNVHFTFQQEKIQRIVQEEIENQEYGEAILSDAFTIEHHPQQYAEELNPITHIVPGYTVMFTFFIIISMVMAFVKDREKGMLARLASTPLTKYHYLIGKWIPYILIVLIQIGLLLIFGAVVYDLQLGNLLALFALSVALAFTTTGLGLAIAVITKSENFGLAITQIIALGGAMLSGLWVPLEILPTFIQKMSTFLPQYWAHQGYIDVMARGAGLTEMIIPILVLIGFGVLGLCLAVLNYPQFLRGAKS